MKLIGQLARVAAVKKVKNELNNGSKLFTALAVNSSDPFSILIDGVTQFNVGAENRLPPTTQYHLSIYQNGSVVDGFLHGGPVPGAENINVEEPPPQGWGLSVTHGTIDDELAVRDLVKARLRTHVPNR